ncbi:MULTISPECIES: hypothetical protein [Kitasatospora]|uniref:Secreted protein n=1 Tax=Kitasatospora setae (strain ATCC 33774 / DSM 43861 / JCM 3304 / KCC A-0304 / NBRC 14216 / KM-6054) TaxID=452652 RepID=E4N1V0_KITSK|nr:MULTISPECIES: hypothetical protein [Kitasatospora]BAJ32134.1 hypothetical protein KSE_63750 [Kitasatospora setae KM-6054]
MRRSPWKTVAVTVAAPLLALAGTATASAADATTKTPYSFWDVTHTCESQVSFYAGPDGTYVQYQLVDHGTDAQGCEAWAITSDGFRGIGHIYSGSFATYDGGTTYITPYVHRVSDYTHPGLPGQTL